VDRSGAQPEKQNESETADDGGNHGSDK
jgi:hypothetical protein